MEAFRKCKRYGVKIWHCPQFLFLLMNLLIIAIILVVFNLSINIIEPHIAALLILFIAATFYVIGYLIIFSFENLAEASWSKSEFISIISHQLRTPISSIKWQLSLILDKKFNLNEEKIRKFLESINQDNEKMINMVNDLLEVSRIEDKSLILNLSSFSLRGLIEEIIPLNIDVSFPDNMSNVFADRVRIKNVIINLIDNAVRYNISSGKVSIELKEIPGFIHFLIKDEGIGISKEDSRMIFTKFFRGVNTLRYKTDGSGIGLYITKNIIKTSGGKIGFESRDGKGSIFWFTLPIIKAEQKIINN